MNIETIKKGTYTVAVSGGVDSVVLLDLLVRQAARRQKRAKRGSQPTLNLVVAHFDHGIRPDSAKDRRFVQQVAKDYNLPFVAARGKLGPAASEATARAARYDFLQRVMDGQQARAIITAHHRDDMLETAILNILRGTGRKGLSSLQSKGELLRPLLDWTKKDIRTYAQGHNLKWREDSTNADERFLRNYIRRTILARFLPENRSELLKKIQTAGRINKEIDELLEQDLAKQPAPDELNRMWYLQLPFAVASEMMAAWLRRNGIAHFDRTLIEHLVVAAKTAKPGKLADVDASHIVEFTKDKIRLGNRTSNSSIAQKTNPPKS